MRKLMRRLTYLLRSRQREADLARELEAHRAMKQERLEQAGLPPDDADVASRRALGNVTLAREDARATWIWPWLESIWQDVQYGGRMLLRNPIFSCVAISTLTLGIGATSAMFSVVNGVLLRPLPYDDPERLVVLWTDDHKRDLHEEATSYVTFTEWRSQNHLFADMALFSPNAVTLTGADMAERVKAAFVSANLFPLLGISPQIGRTFSQAEEDGMERLVLLSHALWQRRFGGDRGVIDRLVTLDGDPNAWKQGPRVVRVIGVMPPQFYFPDKDTHVWEPAKVYWRWQRESTERFFNRWSIVARLQPSVEISRASIEMTTLGRRLEQAYPPRDPGFPGFTANVIPILEQMTGRQFQLALWVLFGAVVFVLLIACTNVANLLLARGAARERELAVRAAIGAGRSRLLRQLLVESLILALVAGVLATVAASGVVGLLVAYAPPGLPRIDEISVDTRVLIFTLGVSFMAALGFGVAPAWKLSQSNPHGTLKQGASGTSPGSHVLRTRGILIVVECALAVILLTGAGLLIHSFLRLQAVDPGFNPENVLLARVSLPRKPISPGTPAVTVFTGRQEQFSRFTERLAAIPGVISVGAVTNFLIPGEANESIHVVGRPIESASQTAGQLASTAVSPDFFRTIGLPLRAGRLLVQDDLAAKIRLFSTGANTAKLPPEPVVVNEAFVRRFFSGEDPLGRRLCVGCPGKSYFYEIVGVVGDARRQGLQKEPVAEFYTLLFGDETADLMLRTTGDPLALAASARQAIRSVDEHALLLTVTTAESRLGELIAERRFQTWMLGLFAAAALILAAIGVYGIIRYAVAQRTREIGIRIALGADAGKVLRMVVRQGMTLTIAGVALGLMGALALTRLMQHMLFEVTSTDPMTFAGVSVLLTAITFVACYLPGRRASRIDPIVALRSE